jgi:small subunit ribosomal protein S6
MATTAEAHKRAREYETIYVLRQDVDPDGADKVAGRVAEVVARENGKLVKVETWGRRKLAYTVAKQKRGVTSAAARSSASSSATCACSTPS